MLHQEFIQKIGSISWDEIDTTHGTERRFVSKNGFALSYYTKFDTNGLGPSIQIVAQVWYKDAHVMSWGHEDEASQLAFVKVWMKINNQIKEQKLVEDSANSSIGRMLFENQNP